MANPTVTQTQKPAQKPATNGAAAPTVDAKPARVRRTQAEVCKEALADVAATITDGAGSLRDRLLSLRDLTPAQRTAALDKTVGAAYREAMEALKVAPTASGSTVDRTADLDF